MKENYFMDMLKIGYKAEEKGVSIDEMYKELKALGYDVKKEQIAKTTSITYSLESSYKEMFLSVKGAYSWLTTTCNIKYKMKIEYVSRYLEYIELKEAREYSKKSLTIAILALFATAVSILISTYFYVNDSSNEIIIENIQKIKYQII